MSGGFVAAAAAGAALAYKGGRDQKKAASAARKQSERQARKQEKDADEAFNRANQKRANPNAALESARQAGRAGAGSTLLTGARGVQKDDLNLGSHSLLGS